MQCLCRPFRDWVRILLIWEGLRVRIERSWWRRWLWHLFRMRYGCPPGEVFRAHPTGRRPRGWPRTHVRDSLSWHGNTFGLPCKRWMNWQRWRKSELPCWNCGPCDLYCISPFLKYFLFILSDLLCATGSHLANAFTYSLTTSPHLLQPFAVIIFCLFYKCVCACTDYELEKKAGRTGVHLHKWRGKYRSDASAPRNTL